MKRPRPVSILTVLLVIIALSVSLTGVYAKPEARSSSHGHTKPQITIITSTTVSDNFTCASGMTTCSPNATLWNSAVTSENGFALVQKGGQLVIDIPASATGSSFQAGVSSNCLLGGDFNATVGYVLMNWPRASKTAGNGVRVGLAAGGPRPIDGAPTAERVSFGEPAKDFPGYPRNVTVIGDAGMPVLGYQQNTESSGKLRVLRTGAMFTGETYNSTTGWTVIATYPVITTSPMSFGLTVWSHDSTFEGLAVRVAFEKFTATAGSVTGCGGGTGALPDVVLSCSPTPLNLMIGELGTSTCGLTSENGFAGNVSIAALKDPFTTSLNVTAPKQAAVPKGGTTHFSVNVVMNPPPSVVNQSGVPICAAPLPCGDLIYNGGPVEHQPTDFLIFWLPPGYSYDTSDTNYEQLIIRYFQDICKPNPLYSILQQYSDASGPPGPCSFGGSWIDTSNYPPLPLPDASIVGEVNSAIATKNWSSNNGNNEFFVFTASGVASVQQLETSFCAYHGSFTSQVGQSVAYAFMPDASNSSTCLLDSSPNGDIVADSEINVASHEQFEAITDPVDVRAWCYQPCSTHEIGDQCAGTSSPFVASLTIGGDNYRVQTEYDNLVHGCTIGGGGYNALPGYYRIVVYVYNGTLSPTFRAFIIGAIISSPGGSGAPDFTVSLGPPSLAIAPGSSGNTNITLTSLNGYTGTVVLEAIISPAQINGPTLLFRNGVALFGGNITLVISGTLPYTATLNVSLPPNIPRGIYTITIQTEGGPTVYPQHTSIVSVSTTPLPT